MSDTKAAEKLERMAETLTRQVEHCRRPMTQNPTPKRLREYRSRLHDADNLDRTRRAMLALAAKHRNGGPPKWLANVRTKDEIARLVHKGTKGGGYYEVIPDPEYMDKSPAAKALQALIDNTLSAEDRAREAERQVADKLQKMEDDLRFAKIPGFFPTPPNLIDAMITRAGIRQGMMVLEPSAGKGDIAEQAVRIVGKGNVVLCEINRRLCEILRAKGFARLTEGDFLDGTIGEGFDRVVMNPPFEQGQDAEHIQHAYKLLRPGGRLVAIMSATAATKHNGKSKALAALLDATAATIEDVPAGQFKGPEVFRNTGVACKLVVIDKPAAAEPPPLATEKEELPPFTAASASGNILDKYRPETLAGVVGQVEAVEALQSFVKKPASTAFIFAGPSGVGKTAAALALARELGCADDFSGLTNIPSGSQDGKAVDALLRSLRLKPLAGLGWKVAIINEADRMTEQAEAMWLDGLEKLPEKSVVIFTTNTIGRLSKRLIRRCEVYQFDGSSDAYRAAMVRHIRQVWQAETGKALKDVPAGLGQFELGDDTYSIALALQQVAPYIRMGKPLPAQFAVPIVRGNAATTRPAQKPAAPSSDADDVRTTPCRVFCRVCKSWVRKGQAVRVYRDPADGREVGWQHAAC